VLKVEKRSAWTPNSSYLLALLSSLPPPLPGPESPIGGETTFPYPVLPFSYTRPLAPGYVGFASAYPPLP